MQCFPHAQKQSARAVLVQHQPQRLGQPTEGSEPRIHTVRHLYPSSAAPRDFSTVPLLLTGNILVRHHFTRTSPVILTRQGTNTVPWYSNAANKGVHASYHIDYQQGHHEALDPLHHMLVGCIQTVLEHTCCEDFRFSYDCHYKKLVAQHFACVACNALSLSLCLCLRLSIIIDNMQRDPATSAADKYTIGDCYGAWRVVLRRVRPEARVQPANMYRQPQTGNTNGQHPTTTDSSTKYDSTK